MNTPREVVAVAFHALFTPLQANPVTSNQPFATVTRVLEVPQNYPLENTPALIDVEWTEGDDERVTFGAQTYDLHYRILILAPMPDVSTGVAPGSVLNPLIDAFEAALKTGVPPGMLQTLGYKVLNCWISGTVLKTEGLLGQYVAAWIPITIRTGE